MKETFALAGMLWTGIILCFALVAILHYGYGKVQGWRKQWRAYKLDAKVMRAVRKWEAGHGSLPPSGTYDWDPASDTMTPVDFPRPMSCQPSKGWIKESRFTVYAMNEREAIDALTSLETVDDG